MPKNIPFPLKNNVWVLLINDRVAKVKREGNLQRHKLRLDTHSLFLGVGANKFETRRSKKVLHNSCVTKNKFCLIGGSNNGNFPAYFPPSPTGNSDSDFVFSKWNTILNHALLVIETLKGQVC